MYDIATHRDEWQADEELAERMIPLIGKLNRTRDVVTSLHGHRLLGLSTTGILEVHERVAALGHGRLELDDTLAVLEALCEIKPGASSIDVARLIAEHAGSDRDLVDYLREALAPALGAEPAEPVDVVLYGFGRIGRLLARILIAHTGGGSGLRLRAVVVRRGAENDLVKRASLLLRDSVHGRFEGSVDVDEEKSQIIANGNRIQVIYSDDPSTVDYTAYGIRDAIIVDNTGRWRDEEGLSRHLQAKGAARVLLTAPGKGELKNIVHGINDSTITDDDRIVSAASCTTNAITPVLKAMDEAYGIVRGHVETVHSFTNDQNLIDNFHKGDRRGRSAVLNMVITETGAAKAVARALPELAGKLTGSAIRVPTPDVSLAVLHLTLENPATKDQLNDYLRRASLHSKLRQQIDYVESPEVVSTDFVGSHRAGIVDGLATIANDRDVVLYVWYDNEYGYSCQVVRVLEVMAGAHPVVLPPRREVTLNA
ncbi:glyceraldehyde-3-phosphate dehydrogenase [Microbacterium esteraromaticum]|uniref:Glyceraldehyde-3-phosphate dehydrogenase n=1 Tax=Microbacterium esteraromaticum TaxID=57043 RepID=A0A939DV15_9MICO|nr:glyceraldehyde-3-phosphate dehydrogenase [Microbacterium esteraromaticum]MBN8205514.1 glyceraldehyde-3-phosphate dehydrogenase [Microbacterium esteraromaticum]MBN8415668.1 glyceraldehyde-3-phosphate dehydrogenase [Microbacterium esteraromaticum]